MDELNYIMFCLEAPCSRFGGVLYLSMPKGPFSYNLSRSCDTHWPKKLYFHVFLNITNTAKLLFLLYIFFNTVHFSGQYYLDSLEELIWDNNPERKTFRLQNRLLHG